MSVAAQQSVRIDNPRCSAIATAAPKNLTFVIPVGYFERSQAIKTATSDINEWHERPPSKVAL
jgi:hypothetical protein